MRRENQNRDRKVGEREREKERKKEEGERKNTTIRHAKASHALQTYDRYTQTAL